MTEPIRKGHIYWVPDSAIHLPPNAKRELHPRRPYLVMSNDGKNTDSDWPVVFGFPLSTSDEHATEFDVAIARGEGGVSKECYVLIALAQALAKSKLGDRTGQLAASKLSEVVARHLYYLGEIG